MHQPFDGYNPWSPTDLPVPGNVHTSDAAFLVTPFTPFGHRDPAAMDIIETIKEQIAANPILLYMKGSPNAPQCGFSAQTVQCLMACNERFAYVDILANPEIRRALPEYANWPTFPQLYVDGELVGGCDIVTAMFQSGELQPLIKDAAARARSSQEATPAAG